MPHFVVSFMKHVLGDNGRQIEICQSTVEIDAPNEGMAMELAKQRFTRQNGFAIGHCMLTASRSRPPAPLRCADRLGRRARSRRVVLPRD
jgi:hypothetical protein